METMQSSNNSPILIAGLGNPDKKYKKTRHNLGFWVIDKFQKENNFPQLRPAKKFNAAISMGAINNKKIILVEPQTFMNNSGQAIKKIISDTKCQMSNIWIVHDDIDICLGKIKISRGHGAGGHKGIESIIQELKTKDFIRFRIGIQPMPGKPDNLEKFVLKTFNKKEAKIIKEATKTCCRALKFAINKGVSRTMTEFNSK